MVMLHFPMQGVQMQSQVRCRTPLGRKAKTQNRSNGVTDSIKTLKNGPHSHTKKSKKIKSHIDVKVEERFITFLIGKFKLHIC